jgi:hypothetical protein
MAFFTILQHFLQEILFIFCLH